MYDEQSIEIPACLLLLLLLLFVVVAIVKTFSSDSVDGPITSIKLFTVSSNAKSEFFF